MNSFRLLLISAVTSCVFLGCSRSDQTPSAGFRLTVQDVATATDVRAALLTIRTTTKATISVDRDGGHDSTVLSEPDAKGFREGSVALLSTRVAPQGDGDVYVLTLIRAQTPDGSYAGGPSTYPLPRATQLADHFSITAKSGDYPLNTRIEIAQLRGKPVTLTVGKPTK
jgi:hypothetical protein